MNSPIRVQRKRSRGWRMPSNTIYVGRPSRWGNPFEVKGEVDAETAVSRFATHLQSYFGWVQAETAKAFYPLPVKSTEFTDWLKPLVGKNLSCWCPLDQKCHADLLLELAAEVAKEKK